MLKIHTVLRWSAVAIGLLAWPVSSYADPVVLGSVTLNGESGTGGTCCLTPGLTGEWFVAIPGLALTPTPELFNLPLTEADVGRTFRVTAASDPDFASAAATLVNARADDVKVGLRFADGLWVPNFFSELSFGVRPDFAGSTITAMTFQLHGLDVTENAATNSRGVRLHFTLAVEGMPGTAATPEPASMLLMATGIAAGVIRRRLSFARRRSALVGGSFGR
jgi:hypothetical protein